MVKSLIEKKILSKFVISSIPVQIRECPQNKTGLLSQHLCQGGSRTWEGWFVTWSGDKNPLVGSRAKTA